MPWSKHLIFLLTRRRWGQERFMTLENVYLVMSQQAHSTLPKDGKRLRVISTNWSQRGPTVSLDGYSSIFCDRAFIPCCFFKGIRQYLSDFSNRVVFENAKLSTTPQVPLKGTPFSKPFMPVRLLKVLQDVCSMQAVIHEIIYGRLKPFLASS